MNKRKEFIFRLPQVVELDSFLSHEVSRAASAFLDAVVAEWIKQNLKDGVPSISYDSGFKHGMFYVRIPVPDDFEGDLTQVVYGKLND